MATLAQLDLVGVRDLLRHAAGVLDDHRAALDRLDVGEDWDPDLLPDAAEDDVDPSRASTAGRAAGSDLARTLGAAAEAASSASSFTALSSALVSGPASAAAGPAGRDLAQVLAGLAESLRNADGLDATRFAIGLELAAERLSVADDGRHAGCLPAVVGVAADAALGAVDSGADLADAVIAAADEGLAELESGPRSNPDLVDRGVVDAAAAGFLLVLDVLASVVTGEPLPAPPVEPSMPSDRTGAKFLVSCRVEPHEGCGLESADWLESTWHELGRIVEFEGVGARWRAALVTTVPGAAIEAIFDVGRPRELHVGIAATGD